MLRQKCGANMPCHMTLYAIVVADAIYYMPLMIQMILAADAFILILYARAMISPEGRVVGSGRGRWRGGRCEMQVQQQVSGVVREWQWCAAKRQWHGRVRGGSERGAGGEKRR